MQIRFKFEKSQQKTGAEDKKYQQPPLTILSYKTAYNRLIRHINDRYWYLTRIPTEIMDKDLREDEEVRNMQIDFFQPQKDGALHGGSGSAGEKRLRAFLTSIHSIQAYTPPEEGCLPLLRCLADILKSKEGHHFSGQLSAAVRGDRFTAAGVQPGESTVNLTGSLAMQGREIIADLNTQADKRYRKYFSDNDSSSISDDSVIAVAAILY